ncbi:MAG: deoxyribodipyrimidine photo-lyase [Hyphomonadaceae bacterium]
MARRPVADAPACIVWLRQDLRLGDNPALHAAAETGRPLIVLYVLDDATPGRWRMGSAARWWLHHSLAVLGDALARRGAALVLRRGIAAEVIAAIAAETGARAVYWNRCYEPFLIDHDTMLKEALARQGIEAKSFSGALLHEPWTVRTQTGGPFKVFTPFWRACLALPVRDPLAAPKRLRALARPPASEALESWSLTPKQPNWAAAFPWTPGEASARRALAAFAEERMRAYPQARDQLGAQGASRLSPHLHFGELSPVQIRAAAGDAPGADKFMQEIGWREFSANLLYHWRDLPDVNWKETFDRFPWRDDAAGLAAWRRGMTGYPVVDAAMRELWRTGYMHNRARMIAASFLTKHLLIDWRAGEAWFWDTLVDADLANNAASWQWVAGCGADAAPYFRIFNPVTQGERYDPDGTYVRRWVPELAALPDRFLHKPWEADAATLRSASVAIGKTYPARIVDHAMARTRALAAYGAL